MVEHSKWAIEISSRCQNRAERSSVFQSDESYSVLDLLLMSELQVSESNGHTD